MLLADVDHEATPGARDEGDGLGSFQDHPPSFGLLVMGCMVKVWHGYVQVQALKRPPSEPSRGLPTSSPHR